MEGYKKTIIGFIPEDWNLTKLRKVSDFSNGKGHEKNIVEEGPFIVVNSKFVSSDGKVRKFSDKNLSPLMKDDIAIVMSDIPNGKAIAKCFLVDKDHTYTLNQRIGSITAYKTVDTKFLYTILNRNRYYLAFDNGVGQTNLRKDEVLDCPIQLPPLPEQRKIAGILSTIDEKIEVIDQQIIETQELKKGLMQRLLTKGIGHTEFKDSTLGRIPKSWEAVPIKSIGAIITGNTPKTAHKEFYESNGFLWATPGDLGRNKYITSTSKTLTQQGFEQTRQLPSKSILVTCIGSTIGKLGMSIGPISTNQQINSVVCNPDNNPEFYFYVLEYMAPYIKTIAGTQAVPLLNKTDFSNILVPHPPLVEQIRITSTLTELDNKKFVLVEKKGYYETLKKGLMQQLLTGRIRVNNLIEA